MTSADRILDALDPEQRTAAEALRGPVCILAGAGTGKTRTITHRIAYGTVTGAIPAGQVQAVTFTTRAASELRSRLRELGAPQVAARTFHSAALRQLQYFWPRIVGGGFPRIIETKLPLLAAAAAAERTELAGPALRDLASEIEWAKATLTSAGDYPTRANLARRSPPVPAETVAAIYSRYEEVKVARGTLDFEDLLLLAAAAIEEHPDVADEVRARYRHFVVDEYQDVNPLQQRLLEAWLGGRDDLCVVGDASQTIYSFTGASAEYLLDFPRRHRGATVVRLVRDYRSTPQVVAFARTVLGTDPGRLPLVAQRPAGPAPVLTRCTDESDEAETIASRCAELIRAGTPAGEIAVLFRINAQSVAFESALAAKEVAYFVRGGERFFDRSDVRQAVQLLRAAARSPADEPVPGLVEHVTEILRAAGWADVAPSGPGAARERYEALRALIGLAEERVAADPAMTLELFVAELAERAAAQHPPTLSGVTLATLHAAKGLEWDVVFIAGANEGLLPISYAVTDEHIAEERRLLYVGITRARQQVLVSYLGGRRRERSRFLPAVPVERTERPQRRRREATPLAIDAPLVEKLRAWRLEQAKALGQPAYCVFNNATLMAIADRKPQTLRELERIPGIGEAKAARFGADVLALVGAESTVR